VRADPARREASHPLPSRHALAGAEMASTHDELARLRDDVVRRALARRPLRRPARIPPRRSLGRLRRRQLGCRPRRTTAWIGGPASAVPAGASQRRPRRPRPAVWTSPAPRREGRRSQPAASARSSSCVRVAALELAEPGLRSWRHWLRISAPCRLCTPFSGGRRRSHPDHRDPSADRRGRRARAGVARSSLRARSAATRWFLRGHSPARRSCLAS